MKRRSSMAAAALALASMLVVAGIAQAGTTRMVRDIDTTGESWPSDLTPFKGLLYFGASTPYKGDELPGPGLSLARTDLSKGKTRLFCGCSFWKLKQGLCFTVSYDEVSERRWEVLFVDTLRVERERPWCTLKIEGSEH